MDWNEISVFTTTQATETISNLLIEIGSKGVMIEDPNDFYFQEKNTITWDYIEKEVFDYGHEDVKVIAYFSQEEDIEAKIELLEKKLNDIQDIGIDLGSLNIEKKIIAQKNWENEWKKYFKVQKVSENIVIKPSWEEYKATDKEKVINIDPGMAFGTGTHETTRMCINAIEKYIKKDDTVLDIGCGSGILSIASALLGAKKVVGVDLDKLAVKISKENVELNGFCEKIDIRHGDLTDVIKEKANIVVANIIADAIVLLSSSVKEFMEEDAFFISSGIINDKKEYVKQTLIEKGFEIVDTVNEGEWNCIIAKIKK